MRRRWVMTIASFLLSIAVVAAQTGQCTEVIQTAIANAEEECNSIGRNQACFGHIALDATGQPDADSFTFSSVGDVVEVASIQTLELDGFNSETGAWGVVLMRIQANLPNTLPGQNVSIILFGDTTLRNAASSVREQVPPEQQHTISADSAVNVRVLPSASSTVLGSINSGAEITATGRSSDNAWIRVLFDDQVGWIAAFLLSGQANLDDLLVVEPDTTQYGPMQAFYLTTSVGRPACNEVPDDGMMVQTPEGSGTINIAVNEIEVQMGSTVYFNLNENRTLSIAPVEGGARVTSGGVTRTAIAGTQVDIQLDDDYGAEGEPSMPETYLGDDDIEYLPYGMLERDIEWDEGLDADEYEDFLEYNAVFENLDLEDLDDVFRYIEEHENDADFDLLGYIIDDLDYYDLGDDLESYFEDEGYDFDDYDSYSGDDDFDNGGDDSSDDFTDESPDDFDESDDDFDDSEDVDESADDESDE